MTQRSLDKISTSDKGAAGGVCPLGDDGLVPEKFLPSTATADGDAVILNSKGKLNLNIIPQGSGSGLDADTVDGLQASALAKSTTQIICNYPLQGGGQLNADLTIGLAQDVLNERLDHKKLLNIGEKTHTEIDSFIGLATETPTSGGIPLAKSGGKIDSGWLDLSSIAVDGCFDIDINGDLEPAESPTSSNTFELDANNDLTPLAG